MRALAICELGSPENLTLVDIELPAPGPGEVTIAIRACALNDVDADIIRGVFGIPVNLPFVPGIEVVGTIKQIGFGVTGWEIGERVAPQVQRKCGNCRPCRTARPDRCQDIEWGSIATSGGYAEELVCRADELIKVPDSLTDEAAAATQVAFGTAWHTLFARGRLRAGETVLVSGADSGLGAAAVQLARWAGARVIGTAGSDEALERAKAQGVEAGVNYAANPSFGPEVRSLSGGGVDLAFEHLGGSVFTASLDSLKKGGRLVTCGTQSRERVHFDIVPHFRGQFEVLGSFTFVQEEVEQVFDLAARGAIEPAVESVFSLTDGARAVARMERGTTYGKIVIMP